MNCGGQAMRQDELGSPEIGRDELGVKMRQHEFLGVKK